MRPAGQPPARTVDLVLAALDPAAPVGQAALAASELALLAPDEDAASVLSSALAEELAPPWVVALLCGANGHVSSYAIVRTILVQQPRRSGAVFAGPAMAQILGAEAIPDLITILESHDEERAREGAAFGLARTGHPLALGPLQAAHRRAAIPRSTAASCLAHLPLDDARMISWVEAADPVEVALGLEVVAHRSASNRIAAPVCAAALRVLDLPSHALSGTSWMAFLPERLRRWRDDSTQGGKGERPGGFGIGEV